MTATTTRQLVLPGQAAAPEGPIDLTPMFVMHAAFRRDVRAFAAAAQHTPVSDRRTWRALQRRWTRFALVLHHHHTGEDAVIWPVLLERTRSAGDTAGVATLEAMAAEHDEIDPLLEACTEELDVMASAADEDARAALQVRLVATGERLTAHLAHEERDALSLVQRYLTVADWDRMDRHLRDTATPRYMVYVMPWVLHGLPAQARRRLRGAAKVSPLLVEPLLRPAFLRLERTAFRHVP